MQRDPTLTINSGPPLLLASHLGHAEIAQFLRGARADIDKPTINSGTLLPLPSHEGHCGARADIDKPDINRGTFLVSASQKGYAEFA